MTDGFKQVAVDKFDRFQSLHRIFLSRKKPVPIAVIAASMECSEKTVRRTIEQMRDYFQAPIVYDAEAKGWQYEAGQEDKFELPGLWLTGQELQSLTLLLHVLEGFGNGLLNKELALMEQQIHRLLGARGISASAFAEHIKVLPLGNRVIAGHVFTEIGEALLKRQQVGIHYKDYSGKTTTRTISPQTLVHYRENWYLDAWCHLRDDLRTFSLARIVRLHKVSAEGNEGVPAKQVAKDRLEAQFASSYGIFSGKGKHMARLRFLPKVAREVSLQQWHPQQQGQWEGEDYLLSFPYSDDRELIGDIQRLLPHVVVEAPAELKKKVKRHLQEALQMYTTKELGWL